MVSREYEVNARVKRAFKVLNEMREHNLVHIENTDTASSVGLQLRCFSHYGYGETIVGFSWKENLQKFTEDYRVEM